MEHSLVLDQWGYHVRPLRMYLVHVHFDSSLPEGEPENDPEEAAPLPEGAFVVRLGLVRLAAMELSVELTVETPSAVPVMFSMTYAADFEMHPGLPEAHREAMWRHVAYYLAPRSLYPYIRELVTNLTSRVPGGPILLPFSPIPLNIPVSEQFVPPSPSDAEFQAEFDLGNVPRTAGQHAH